MRENGNNLKKNSKNYDKFIFKRKMKRIKQKKTTNLNENTIKANRNDHKNC